MRSPLVTAIITTHNRLSLLKRAVDSVLGQTYDNIELLVIDDCSTDGTREWASVQPDISYFYIDPQNSGGACFARNVGIERANGEFIAFLDDDDEWVPEKIEKQVSMMSDDVSVVSAQWEREFANGKWVRALSCEDDWLLEKLLMRCNAGATSVPLLRKSAVVAAGAFDEEVVKGQEHDLWIRLVSNGCNVRVVNESLVKYYHSGDSCYESKEKLVQCTEYKLSKYRKLYKSHPIARCYLLNDTALKLLKDHKDLPGFIYYKRKALSSKLFSRYNFFEFIYLKQRIFGDGFFLRLTNE